MSASHLSKQPKIAFVADWLTSFGGGERTLFAMHDIFPDAPIFTTVYDKENFPMLQNSNVITSYLDKFPFAPWSRKKHQLFLTGMPLAFEAFDFSDYDIVISSSHACSKGIITKVDTLHICYCHSPMRYAWDDCHRYINENAPFPHLGGKWIAKRVMHKMRMWDRLAAERVDTFVANSKYIKKRIEKYYQRDAHVVYPPIPTGNFYISEKKDYYLAGGRLIKNKKIELVIEAFNYLGLPLKVYGKGPELEPLKKMAKENIEFVGFVTDEELAKLFSEALAFVVPQLEDFGIVTVEALSSGTPVIGLRAGGTEEIVIDGVTGVLMDEQTTPCLIDAVRTFDRMRFDSEKIRQHALKYDIVRFKREFTDLVLKEYEHWQEHMIIKH